MPRRRASMSICPPTELRTMPSAGGCPVVPSPSVGPSSAVSNANRIGQDFHTSVSAAARASISQREECAGLLAYVMCYVLQCKVRVWRPPPQCRSLRWRAAPAATASSTQSPSPSPQTCSGSPCCETPVSKTARALNAFMGRWRTRAATRRPCCEGCHAWLTAR